jgi:hypothetical protein
MDFFILNSDRTFSWICSTLIFRLLKLPNAIGLMLVSLIFSFYFNHGLLFSSEVPKNE